MVTSSYGLKVMPSEIFVLHFTLYFKPSALINLQDLVENMLFYFAHTKGIF